MSIESLGQGIRSIADLLGDLFYVAEYQRGYKWTPSEVLQLLDDVDGFKPGEHGTFYCLQPLVVATRTVREWELIDGQQRMTTLFLILTYLNQKPFQLEYCTRPGTKTFLETIGALGIDAESDWQSYAVEHATHDNIDNYHLFEAYKAIVKWRPANRSGFQDKLLNYTGIIWHKVTGTDHKTLFLHLNSGRILLTNAELIKALFLSKKTYVENREAFELKQKEMAQEWDGMEYALQDDSFWFFLNQKAQAKDSATTRIDFIFDLLTKKPGKSPDPLHSYLHFAALDNRGHFDANTEWKEVKRCYLTLQEWFEDDDLYHDIGFLLTQELAKIEDLYNESRGKKKSEFRASVTALVEQTFKECDVDTLCYGEDDKLIHNVLLLFNLKSLKDGARFPFDRFKDKDEAWSLEHIHARNPKPLNTEEKWVKWVEEVTSILGRMQGAEALAIKEALENAKAPQQKAEELKEYREELQVKVFRFLGPEIEKEEQVHGLGNLALLSRKLNSSLGNGIFSSKRQKIIDGDKEGQFIPIATKNVFLKYFGGEIEQMHKWMPDDRKAYLAEIKKTLGPYLKREEESG